jgi:alkaline phosphatase
MNILKKYYFILPAVAVLVFPSVLAAQEVLIHSHNDYVQRVPFYQAYAQQVASIEADIYLIEDSGMLLVAHTPLELAGAPTLDDAYIQPLVKLYKQNDGKAWRNSDKRLNLMIDIKTAATPTLNKLVEILQPYPDVFDSNVNPFAVRVIISGNAPEANEFDEYPSFIAFDGSRTDYTPAQLKRIGMISFSFRNFTQWNGKGNMVKDDYRKVTEIIDRVHAAGKPIRFWGTPDGVTAWNTFYNLGVDYINTDQVEDCAAFFRNFHKKTFRMANTDNTEDVARAKRLDKTTAGFQGFQNKNLQLSKAIDVYQPTNRNNGQKKKVKNVILMIGDGMGLSQICAADAVNRGLTLLHLKHIGLLNTEAADDFTTDSAAGGSALATGKKNDNRHISMDDSGEKYLALSDIFHANGYANGVVTLGNMADATPAAFYGHAIDRDSSNEITAYLREGVLDLLSGSGMNELTDRTDGIDLIKELTTKGGYTLQTNMEDINKTKGKVICIDERMGQAAAEETLSLLADATREAIKKLTDQSSKGFFLMVEGAKIDYAGHANSLPGAILEMLSFDLAIAEVLKFADSNGETLVVITADHETGGLTLIDGYQEQNTLTALYVTDDHTPIRIPLFAYGPWADEFTGAYQNTEVFHKIKKATKLKIIE